jgi:two-component system, OmpR family, response regulator
MTKILIVDDEESLRALYSATLRRAGYEVLTAGNAKKAVELALSAKPALILLDVMMPSVDGGEAYAYLSGNPATADIPIIFLTSLVREEEAGAGKIGGKEYISKSTPLPKFVALVKEALSRARVKN